MGSSAGGTRGVFCALVQCRTFVWSPRVWCHTFGWAGHDTSARHRATVEVSGGAAWCNPVVQRALADDAANAAPSHQCRRNLQLALLQNPAGRQVKHARAVNRPAVLTQGYFCCRDFTGERKRCRNVQPSSSLCKIYAAKARV
ncbi:hypothetical protein HPB52_019726 [Rhipicephalus sanguineus]|uniref:Uncharacterized protein n=1 Tax=Rhipicephalus sanguineus TaxID=34632 RepID=A0A9D4T837_RHISA|nr:hypothetical protein HPB52_019726 [Rhipicephalus sanguineus]